MYILDIYFVLLGIAGISTLSNACVSGSNDTPSVKSFNNRCYEFVVDRKLTWTRAEQDCVRKHGHLATVSDPLVKQFLQDELYANTQEVSEFWIGLASRQQKWLWAAGDHVTSRDWESIFPTDDASQCVYISGHANRWSWRTTKCTSVADLLYSSIKLNYICQYDLDPRSKREAPAKRLLNGCPYAVSKQGTNVYNFNNVNYELMLNAFVHGIEAQSACHKKGGNLVSIPDLTTQTCLLYVIKNLLGYSGSGVWIGLTDLQREGLWKWYSGDPVTFHHWGAGEPSLLLGGNEDCVLLDTDTGYWKDLNCNGGFLFSSNRHAYVCQYPTTTSTAIAANTTTAQTTTTVQSCPLMMTCPLDCGLTGFQLDPKGCPLCDCATMPTSVPT